MRIPIPKNIKLNFASTIFIGVTLFLSWQGALWSQLFSIVGVAFLLCGLLVTGLLIGKPVNALHKRYSVKMIEANGGELTESIANRIRFTGTIAMLLQVLIVYYGTSLVFLRVAS